MQAIIVNGAINAVKNNDDKPVDIELFDIEKCFDSLWLKECMNDLYEVGLQNSNLNLLYEGNKECYMAVKTPHGKTNRVLLREIVMCFSNKNSSNSFLSLFVSNT